MKSGSAGFAIGMDSLSAVSLMVVLYVIRVFTLPKPGDLDRKCSAGYLPLWRILVHIWGAAANQEAKAWLKYAVCDRVKAIKRPKTRVRQLFRLILVDYEIDLAAATSYNQAVVKSHPVSAGTAEPDDRAGKHWYTMLPRPWQGCLKFISIGLQ